MTGDLLDRARKLEFGGCYLIPPFGKVELAIALLQRIRKMGSPAASKR